MYTDKGNSEAIGTRLMQSSYREEDDNGSIQAKAITGLYEETGKGRTGKRPIRHFYREIVDVGLLEEKTDNGCIRGAVMAGL